MFKKKDRINVVKNTKKGFTLVELLIVISIVAVLAVMMISIFNAIGVTNKARDTQRKKDLNRIKVAFEEYFNDKGYFPSDTDIINWNIKSNCSKSVTAFPNLNPWVCDPNGNPYIIITEPNNKFRIITNLENKTDKDIPIGWYQKTDFKVRGLSIDNVNYGVSSTNILWYENIGVDPSCDISACFISYKNDPGSCGHMGMDPGCSNKLGDRCYYSQSCNSTPLCETTCCGNGCQ